MPQYTSQLALAGGAVAVTTAVLLALRRRRRRLLTPVTTASIEEHGRCALCGSRSLFLDAAINELRCPSCDTHLARDGVQGDVALDEDGSHVRFMPAELDPSLLKRLRAEIKWAQHEDLLPDGRVILQPRLIAYQADDPSLVYSYEGLTQPLHPEPFTPHVAAIKAQVEKLTGERFNSCHLNLYRCGGDHVSWHTDEDPDLYGLAPCIASVSFGATRAFVLRRMRGEPYAPSWRPSLPSQMWRYALGSGSLLVMSGATQRHWEHCVLKQAAATGRRTGAEDGVLGEGPRINMTFRAVVGRRDERCPKPA